MITYEGPPFPHAVMDGLLGEDLVDSMLTEFPARYDPIWQNTNDAVQVKSRTNWKSLGDIPPHTKRAVLHLNSGVFLRQISQITGIKHLISDPYLTGGGLNAIYKGGFLDIHCDGNWHDDMAVERRLNLILYLNDSDGDLELWDTECRKKITPKKNSLVIFETAE